MRVAVVLLLVVCSSAVASWPRVRVRVRVRADIDVNKRSLTDRQHPCVRVCDFKAKPETVCSFKCSRLCIPGEVEFADLANAPVTTSFKACDKDQDGFISFAEFVEATDVMKQCAVEPFQLADLDCMKARTS